MKKITGQSRVINRISRRDNLPVLRGMFISPGSSEKKTRPVQRQVNFYLTSEEELYLTADKGFYLGEY
ncbi:MAG: hypothetical protein NT040_15935 [Bacteroidetes bacterium]|nr:hypothetical protein [Bacteroidota bacterium]